MRHLAVGVTHKSEAATAPIVAYWANRWTPADLALTKVVPGDPAGQARLEALTLLSSVATQRPALATAQGSLTNSGDARGVLHDPSSSSYANPVSAAIGASSL